MDLFAVPARTAVRVGRFSSTDCRGASLQRGMLSASVQRLGMLSRIQLRDLRARAVSTETYWVTVAQAVSFAVGVGASGVVAGLLLRYKCWREARAEVARLEAEGLTPEEILQRAMEDEGVAAALLADGGMGEERLLALGFQASPEDSMEAGEAASEVAAEADGEGDGVEGRGEGQESGSGSADRLAQAGSKAGRKKRPVLIE